MKSPGDSVEETSMLYCRVAFAHCLCAEVSLDLHYVFE